MKKDFDLSSITDEVVEKTSYNLSNKILKKGIISIIFLSICFIVINFLKDDIEIIVPDFLPVLKNISIIFLILSIIYVIITFINRNKYDKNRFKDDKIYELKIMYKIYNFYDLINYAFICFYVLYIIIAFWITPTNVEGSSMNPTLNTGDKLLINQLYKNINNEDIVVFNPKNYLKTYYETADFKNDNNAYIKRVLAKPGDKVEFKDNNVYVNGLIENRIPVSNYTEFKIILSYENMILIESETEFIIPNDLYILIGDNYNYSFDSTELGLIHEEDIIGKAILRFYPFSLFGKL